MAVKLRLRREGTKKQPHYRVVAADSRSPRNGRFIEIIGEYHPLDQPSTIRIDEERALHWLQVGAQPTDQVEKLLRIVGVWEQFKPGDAPKRDRGATGEPTERTSKKRREKAKAAADEAAAPEPKPAAPEPEPEPAAEEPAAEEPAAEEPAAEEPAAEEPAAETPAEEAEVKAEAAAEEQADAEAPDEETAAEGGE